MHDRTSITINYKRQTTSHLSLKASESIKDGVRSKDNKPRTIFGKHRAPFIKYVCEHKAESIAHLKFILESIEVLPGRYICYSLSYFLSYIARKSYRARDRSNGDHGINNAYQSVETRDETKKADDIM